MENFKINKLRKICEKHNIKIRNTDNYQKLKKKISKSIKRRKR